MNNIHHIADWIMGSVGNDDPWLSDCDKYGRPKKLLKLGSLQQACKEADKTMILRSQRYATDSNLQKEINDGDIELVGYFDDNEYHDGINMDSDYVLVRLKTPQSLDRESGFMQHCITLYW